MQEHSVFRIYYLKRFYHNFNFFAILKLNMQITPIHATAKLKISRLIVDLRRVQGPKGTFTLFRALQVLK